MDPPAPARSETPTERVLLSPLDLKKKPKEKPVAVVPQKKGVLTKQMFQEKMLTLLEVNAWRPPLFDLAFNLES